jgi:hypothetical protein
MRGNVTVAGFAAMIVIDKYVMIARMCIFVIKMPVESVTSVRIVG